ncbi:MAG TPA: hypothetical protein VLE44_00225 [Candidatus Saccharimonadales bacterium]|nr:hypothetical protein [Candidatus Saccharimonadales bacterium]
MKDSKLLEILALLDERLSILEKDYEKRQEDEAAVTNYLMDIKHDKEALED